MTSKKVSTSEEKWAILPDKKYLKLSIYFQGGPERRPGWQVLQQPRAGRPLPDRPERGRHRRLPTGRGRAGPAGGAPQAGGLGHAEVLPVHRAGLPEEEGGSREAENPVNQCANILSSIVMFSIKSITCFRAIINSVL